MPRPRAILLSGPVGSGKTTVLVEIGELLEGMDEPYALVDADWLAWLRPAADGRLTVHDVLVENLRAVWETFRRAGVRRLVVARFLQRVEQVDAIRHALDETDLFVVRLAMPMQELDERLRERDSGRELAEHLALIEESEAAGFEDAVVDAGRERPASEIAAEILTLAGWRSG
jgi:adenylylsulfate kinase-like enzyme